MNGSGGSAGYTIGITASLPLLDGGQRRADADAATAKLDRAIADAQSVRQSIDQDAATAWLGWQTATQQVAVAQIGVAAAQQAYDLASMRYNAGKSIAVERLNALATLTQARGDLAQAKAGVIDAAARLQAAIGTRSQLFDSPPVSRGIIEGK
jgi:outer membrane protein TolC